MKLTSILTQRINPQQKSTSDHQIDGLNRNKTHHSPRRLAECIVHNSVRGGESFSKEWVEVKISCRLHDINFLNFVCEDKYQGKTFLEHIIEKWDGRSANFIFRQLDNGEYAGGKIKKDNTGILIINDHMPNRSIGFEQINKRGFYIGDFVNGQRQGSGKLDNLMGYVYEGEWKQDRRHGYGKIYERGSEKNCQSGFFQDGMMVGYEKKSVIEKFGFSLRRAKH